MDCEISVALLSDYHEGILGEDDHGEVQAHLAICITCADVFNEIQMIVITAGGLCDGPCLTFPDENVIWQRLSIKNRTA